MREYPYKPDISDDLLGALTSVRDSYIKLAEIQIEGMQGMGDSSPLGKLQAELEGASHGKPIYRKSIDELSATFRGIDTLNGILKYKDGIPDQKEAQKFTQHVVDCFALATDPIMATAGSSEIIDRGPGLPPAKLNLSINHTVRTYWDDMNTLLKQQLPHNTFIQRKAAQSVVGHTAEMLHFDDPFPLPSM